jgi:sigma-B regulation protein RsbU (phosphoserine phosphatase)
MLAKLRVGPRLAILVLLGTGIVLAGILTVSYIRGRALLEEGLEARAEQTALAATNQIDAIQAAAEKIALANVNILAHDVPDEAELYRLVRTTVATNPEIMGAAIALNPASGEAASYSAPYAWRSGESIATKDLGEGGYAYDQWEWFTAPRDGRAPVWSEPYFDTGGGESLMVTYSAPVFSAADPRRFVAVATVDISLEWLTRMLGELPLGNGYAFLLSREGAFVSHPIRGLIMKQTIFSVADEHDDDALRELGRRMVAGESGFVPFRSVLTGRVGWVAFAPMQRSGGSLGLVFSRKDVTADVVALNHGVAAAGLIDFALLALVTLSIARTITRPLERLEVATTTLGDGDLEAELPAFPGDDEVARLAVSFGAMRDRLREHIEQLRITTAANERINSELEMARAIQMGLVPKTFPPFPERRDLDLHAILEPARQIGGDYYDFLMPDERHICIAVADVSGKGMPAALFMAVTRTLLRALYEPGAGPGAVLERLNDELARDNDAAMFVTIFFACIDLANGTCTWARGGHNQPFLLRADGEVEMLPATDGAVVGVMEGLRFAEGSVRLEAGDTLFVYTDGVTEAMSPADELFGNERTIAALQRCRGESCAGLLGCVREEIAAHAAGAEQSDDITMLAIRLLNLHDAPS